MMRMFKNPENMVFPQQLYFRSEREAKNAQTWVKHHLKIKSDDVIKHPADKFYPRGKFEYVFFARTFLTQVQMDHLCRATKPQTYSLNNPTWKR